MNLMIRLADTADAVVAAGHLFDTPPTRSGAQAFLRTPGHHLLLAYVGDDPAGFVSGVEMRHPDKEPEMFVYELGVDEAYRGRGIASALLRSLGALAATRGLRGLWTATEADNLAAQATYARAGADAEAVVAYTWSVPEAATSMECRPDGH